MLHQIMLRIRAGYLSWVIALVIPFAAVGQDSTPSGAVDLALKQSQLADRYRQLESLLLKMAEYDSGANPRRAALLRQALSKGKERQIGGQLDELVKLFQREQLQRAVDGQAAVQTDLKTLLDLLLSENRPDRLKSEQARVRNYIKQLDRIIRQQKSVQGRTENGEPGDRLGKDQQRIADQTQQLGRAIDEAEGTSSPESQQDRQQGSKETMDGDGDSRGEGGKGDKQAGDAESEQTESEGSEGSDSQSAEGDKKEGEEEAQPGEAKSEVGKSKSGSSKSGEQDKQGEQPTKGSQGGKGGDQEGSDGQQSGEQQSGQGGQGQQQGEQDQQQQETPQFPGRKRIAAAEDRMRQAKEDLERANRDDAVEKQEQAKRLLEQAKAELEEILRQLREEEIERVLALLEGRFRRMLEMELKVQDVTVRLNKTPAAKRTRQFTVRAGKLSLDQRKIVLEVDKALTLLREEGSSVAFPEAVDQMRSDMQSVARRLAEEKVGSLTQAIEADIVTAIEEMIAALQMAQQEAEERRNRPQQQQPQQQADPANQPLVNKIAELKMIRALQMRVNTRTQRYSKMLTDVEDPVGQATDDDLLDSLRELSDRQKRIYKVTSDIVLGKNK